MIERVFNKEIANSCDELLTKLIQDERQYDKSIDKDFIVNNYFKNIVKNEENILLCYKQENKVVGYIFLKPICNDTQKGYLIDGLYVDKQYRHNGIGKLLVKEAIQLVNKKCDFIDINVLYANKIAFEFYKSFGFDEFKINMRINF